MAEKTLKVTLVKSPIGAVPKNKATVKSMGFTKVNQSKVFPDNAPVDISMSYGSTLW